MISHIFSEGGARLKLPSEIMPPLKDIKFVPDIIIKPKPLIYNWTVKHQDKVDRVDRPDKVDNVSVKYIYFVTKDDEKRTGHGRVQYGTSYFKSSKRFHLHILCTTSLGLGVFRIRFFGDSIVFYLGFYRVLKEFLWALSFFFFVSFGIFFEGFLWDLPYFFYKVFSGVFLLGVLLRGF